MVMLHRFMGIGYLKVFIGLARDRFESLLSSPSASINAHTWTFSLLVLTLLKSVLWFFYIMKAWPERSTTVLVFWMFDVVILGIEILQAMVKYGMPLCVSCWTVSFVSGSTLPSHLCFPRAAPGFGNCAKM